jgi:hypothetical protein
MSESVSDVLRAESRFEVAGAEQLDVTVHRTDDDNAVPVAAHLLDLSPSGARLRLAAPPTFQESVRLRIESRNFDVELEIAATVIWIRPAADEQWTVGCSFVPHLPERCVRDLFAKGLLERRKSPRRPLAGRAMARWELSPVAVAVSLLDVSAGGFSVLSPVAVVTGSRMLLVAREGTEGHPSIEIPAKVRWQLQGTDGCAVGCEFTTTNGLSLLREALPETAEPWLELGERRLSLLSLLGIVAIVALCCVFVLSR